jgi:hypothetical protein
MGADPAPQNYPLPQSKIDLKESGNLFKYTYGVSCLALSIYKADAVNRLSKETILKDYGKIASGGELTFDLNNIGIGKRGWTRHYVFSVGDRQFIARIFLTKERFYQPKVKVLYEISMESPEVTLQILPGLNSILKDCRIKPQDFSFSRQTDSSL